MTTYVNFTKGKFERFKKAFAECDGDVFIFEKKQFLKDYARHLIEYLTPKFPDPAPEPEPTPEPEEPAAPAAPDSTTEPESE